MAFGDHKGSLTFNLSSTTTPHNATGTVNGVARGDLVFVCFCEQTNLTAASVTDNLGNSYSAVNAGTDAGNVTIRCFYSIVTVAGTLTQVSIVVTNSADDCSSIASVIEGPFVSIDANPANTTDGTSPHDCPPSGTLAQPVEVVMAACAINANATLNATSPGVLTLAANRVNASCAVQRIVKSNTTTVTPQFGNGATANAAQTTASFRAPQVKTEGWYPLRALEPPAIKIMPSGASWAPSAPTEAAPAEDVRIFGALSQAPQQLLLREGWTGLVIVPPAAPEGVQIFSPLSLIPQQLYPRDGVPGLIVPPPAAEPPVTAGDLPLFSVTFAHIFGRSLYYQALAEPPYRVLGNTQTIDKWQQPLARNAPVPPVKVGYSVVPSDTPSVKAHTIEKWLQPLRWAVPTPPTWPGSSFVPFNTAQFIADNTQTIDKWQQPLARQPAPNEARVGAVFAPSEPMPAPPAVPDFISFGITHSYVFTRTLYYQAKTEVRFVAAPVTLRTEWDWYQQLAQQPSPNKPREGIAVNWRSQFQQDNFRAPWDWYHPLAVMPSVKVRIGYVAYAFRDTQFTQNTVDISRWQQPLARQPAPNRPREGIAVNWRSPVVVQNLRTAWDWFSPLVAAPPPTKLREGLAVNWRSQFQAENFRTPWDWYQPLAVMPSVKVRIGFVAYAWRDTAFTQNTVDISRWQQPLARQPAPNKPREGLAVNWRSPVVVQNLRTSWDWYQPLVAAPPPTKLREGIVVNWRSQFQQDNFRASWDWYQPLDSQPPPNRPREGFIANWRSRILVDNSRTAWDWFSPFDVMPQVQARLGFFSYAFRPTAFTQNTVDISRWQQPLSVAAQTPPVREGLAVNWRMEASNRRTQWDWFWPLAAMPVSVVAPSGVISNWNSAVQPSNRRTQWDWHRNLAKMPPPNVPRHGFIYNWYRTIQVLPRETTSQRTQPFRIRRPGDTLFRRPSGPSIRRPENK